MKVDGTTPCIGWFYLGPLLRDPLRKKETSTFNAGIQGPKPRYENVSQFEGIPTTVLSKTGHMFSTFLLCSKTV